MNLEITERQGDVTFEVPNVNFPAYEEYKAKAQAVAEYIYTMDIDEDGIKEVKSTLARARKLTDRLNRVRIDMKKEILKNYTQFEGQVKEITGIVETADKDLRGKVKELEEAEREAKKQKILEIWDKRVTAYHGLEKVMPDAFIRWLSPKHLNKTTSMKTVEADMVEWLTKTNNDMTAAAAMGEEYLAAYGWRGNLAEAIEIVEDKKKANEAIEELLEANDTSAEETATFRIIGRKDIALTERLLNENNIIYRKES